MLGYLCWHFSSVQNLCFGPVLWTQSCMVWLHKCFLRNLCNQKYLKPCCSCTSVVLFLQVVLYFSVVFWALECVYEMKSNRLFTHTDSKAGTEIIIVNGTWHYSLATPIELHILKRCPATLQGKDEKESTSCKCPLMQFKWQPGKTRSCSFWVPWTWKHRVVYYSNPHCVT